MFLIMYFVYVLNTGLFKQQAVYLTAQKDELFYLRFLLYMWTNAHFSANSFTFTKEILKGAPMQIWKSVNIFVFIWK